MPRTAEPTSDRTNPTRRDEGAGVGLDLSNHGAGEAQRGGINAAVEARIGGIAKSNDESEYTISNEVIAARIGQTLGLPVPAGVIAEASSKRMYYLSLDVSREGKSLPPIRAQEFSATSLCSPRGSSSSTC